MIFRVKGNLTIDGVPDREVVAAAVKRGWIRFPVTFEKRNPDYRRDEDAPTTDAIQPNPDV